MPVIQRPGRSKPEGMKLGRSGSRVGAELTGIEESGPRRGLGRKAEGGSMWAVARRGVARQDDGELGRGC